MAIIARMLYTRPTDRANKLNSVDAALSVQISHSFPAIMYRFNPSLPEAIESIETNGVKLCDLVVNAKQLLENNDLKLDLLIQHFYYTAVQQR